MIPRSLYIKVKSVLIVLTIRC
ncbi:hypothetical protein PT2222_120260 [Paraburkholderia tropica]